MNAVDAVRMARTAGLELEVDGDDLLLVAPAPPPASILDVLSHHKASVVAFLRSRGDGWSAENWWPFFDGGADVAERRGGATRAQALERAFACCIAEWQDRHSVRSPNGRCFACGGDDRPREPSPPFGTDPSGPVWLHSCCWPAWYAGRNAKAAAELAAMGIGPLAKFAIDFGKNGVA